VARKPVARRHERVGAQLRFKPGSDEFIWFGGKRLWMFVSRCADCSGCRRTAPLPSPAQLLCLAAPNTIVLHDTDSDGRHRIVHLGADHGHADDLAGGHDAESLDGRITGTPSGSGYYIVTSR